MAATAAKQKAATPKASGAKKKPAAAAPSKPAGPGALAAGGGVAGALAKTETSSGDSGETGTKTPPTKEVESFAARGIDGALELMDVVTAKADKASRGQAAAGLEKHPEVHRSARSV